jgi:hypothetical protein
MGVSQSVMGFGALEKIGDLGVLNGVHNNFAPTFDGLSNPAADLDLHRWEAGFDAARLATSEGALAAGLVSLYTPGAPSAGSGTAF